MKPTANMNRISPSNEGSGNICLGEGRVMGGRDCEFPKRSLVSRITKRIERYLQKLFRLFSPNSVLVCLQGDLNNLPESSQDISPLYIKEMDMQDELHIQEWLGIHNDAFERNWGVQQFRVYVVDEPDLDITHTYFLMDGDEAIGATSMGVFRRNRAVGVGHYIGVRKKYQGRGLGKYLAWYRFRLLFKQGLEIGESQTTLMHKASLFTHFDLGFRPKLKLDRWNSSNKTSKGLRQWTNARLRNIYQQWQQAHEN